MSKLYLVLALRLGEPINCATLVREGEASFTAGHLGEGVRGTLIIGFIAVEQRESLVVGLHCCSLVAQEWKLELVVIG